MILIADAIHNFVGGVGVGAGFIVDIKLGASMWFIALLHEIPQEIGDFAILIGSSLEKKKALVLNVLSSLTFLLGMLLVFGLNTQLDISFLILFVVGNFIYIAASLKKLLTHIEKSEKHAKDHAKHSKLHKKYKAEHAKHEKMHAKVAKIAKEISKLKL